MRRHSSCIYNYICNIIATWLGLGRMHFLLEFVNFPCLWILIIFGGTLKGRFKVEQLAGEVGWYKAKICQFKGEDTIKGRWLRNRVSVCLIARIFSFWNKSYMICVVAAGNVISLLRTRHELVICIRRSRVLFDIKEN